MKGDPSDDTNPFQHDSVKTNLPRSPTYDPSLPWFSVLDKLLMLASILAIYVDDERCQCSSEEKAWQSAHQISTRECYLGIQDAARKRRPPSQSAGAWAGSIIRTNNQEVGILVSEERWSKTRSIIRKWVDEIRKNPASDLCVKDLLSDRGFLIYVTRTYSPMIPYLKGLHLTIDSWRGGRDDDGWKLATEYAQRERKEIHARATKHNRVDYPDTVKPVSRLLSDLSALEELTEDRIAPIVIVRSKRICVVKYGFGDASGGGFGSSLTSKIGIEIQIGTWNERSSGSTSNFREMGNFVIRLEKDGAEGKLDGCEVFFFTDNSTAEAGFHNGTSSSKTLFDLVLRLRKLQMKYGVKIHLIHVAGTRMIEQGTDGISRGNLLEGVMTGKNMLDFVPIHLTALERSPALLHWIRQWTMLPSLIPLEPKDWIWKGQGLSTEFWHNCDGMKFPVVGSDTTLLWSPPPIIADVALEYLRTSLHRRPQLCHIFVCPKLVTHKWRKNLLKSCDLSFYIDTGPNFWSGDMHESLLIGIYLPLLPCYPWTYRRSATVLEVERLVREMQKTKAGSPGSVLRKFLKLSRRIPSMQNDMVWKLLSTGRVR